MSFIDKEEIIRSLRTGGKYYISFTGDSIASCEWVHPNWRDIVIYVLQCEFTKYMDGDWKTVEWGLKGFNFAYDGSTTSDIVTKTDEIMMVNPNLVICLMGGNDKTYHVTPEQSVENIMKFSKTINDSRVKVAWSNTIASISTQINTKYKPYTHLFMQIPDTTSFFKIDMFGKYSAFPVEKFFTFISEEIPEENVKEGDPDVWHPNQLGNSYIAKVILDTIFGIDFDPEKYITDTLLGKKHPGYQ
ncbi:SGNH/GDSL hydrolase family protein [Candidatus Woesebacteria bacterium]|nr:MAG: SGNH/GDSL hydrolase family protein [Candidatus Woesebacteria bacterium]